MARVEFQPTGVVAEASEGENLFDVGKRADIDIETACVGKGTCGLCRIIVREGEEHLSDYNDVEEKHLGNVYWLTKTRLSCQAVCTGDGNITVEVVRKK